jgi:hypothetical protein
MNIARPVNGFFLIEKQIVTQTINAASGSCLWLPLAYSNMIARLRLAGHRIGVPVNNVASMRVFVEACPDTGANRLAVAYHVLGDTLTILSVKVVI